jgi:hypothetical protein
MFHWDTAIVKAAMVKAFPNCKITLEEFGGDYDTTSVWVSRSNPDYNKSDEYSEKISNMGVWGMNINTDVTTPDNVDVEIVFIGCDQKYGIEEASADEFVLCGEMVRVMKTIGASYLDTGGWKAHF